MPFGPADAASGTRGQRKLTHDGHALLTTIGKAAVALFPDQSTAMQLTQFVPIGNLLPDAGNVVTCTGWLQLSVVPTVKFTTTPLASAHRTIIGSGSFNSGGVRSRCTFTAMVNDSVWPRLSAAVQFTVVTPCWNTLPDGGTQVTVTDCPQSGVAVTVQFA